MEKIVVSKDELLLALRQNRDDHRQIFLEALAGYRREAQAELETMLANLKQGLNRDIYVSRPIPKDHTGDYDRTIRMIEMAIGDTMTLSEKDFAQYVMDDWGWQGQFLSNVYGSETGTKKFSDRYIVE